MNTLDITFSPILLHDTYVKIYYYIDSKLQTHD